MHRQFLILCLTLTAMGAVAAPVDTNQSLTLADQHCQRIVAGNHDALGQLAGGEANHWDVRLLALSVSYADMEDHFLGKDAMAYDTTLALGASYNDWLDLIVTAGREHYEWDGDAFELDGSFVQVAALFRLTDSFAIGPFFEVSEVSIDPGGAGHSEDHMFYAGGLLATQAWELGKTRIGLTGTLASMNKSNLRELFDQRDTALAAILDVTQPLTDSLSATVYAYYYSLLRNERDTDGHYWQFGAELEQRFATHWAVTLGLTTLAASDDYDELRYSAGLAYLF